MIRIAASSSSPAPSEPSAPAAMLSTCRTCRSTATSRPSAERPDQTHRLPGAVARGPRIAIADIKRALAASRTNALREQDGLESKRQLRAFRSNDASEGMAAFFEKRPQKFKGE